MIPDWEPAWSSMSEEDAILGRMLPQMEAIREALRTAGDVLRASEVDAWFRTHAAAIRRVRDLLEPPF